MNQVWFSSIVLGLMGLLAAWMNEKEPLDIDLFGHSLSGTATAFLLVFRTQRAFGMYWEGRSLLSQLESAIRDLAVEVAAGHETDDIVPEKREEATQAKRRIVRYLIMYYALVVEHVRAKYGFEHWKAANSMSESYMLDPEIAYFRKVYSTPVYPKKSKFSMGAFFLDGGRVQKASTFTAKVTRNSTRSKPLVVTKWLRARIMKSVLQGFLSNAQVTTTDRKVSKMVECYAGIKTINTEIPPFPYLQLLRTVMFVWTFTFPFAIANRMGYYTPWCSALIGFLYYGLDAVSDRLQSPFGVDDCDFPLGLRGKSMGNDLDDICDDECSNPIEETNDWVEERGVDNHYHIPSSEVVIKSDSNREKFLSTFGPGSKKVTPMHMGQVEMLHMQEGDNIQFDD